MAATVRGELDGSGTARGHGPTFGNRDRFLGVGPGIHGGRPEGSRYPLTVVVAPSASREIRIACGHSLWPLDRGSRVPQLWSQGVRFPLRLGCPTRRLVNEV